MMSTREPLMTFDDPLMTPDTTGDDISADSAEDCTHDAVIPIEDSDVCSKAAVNVRLDRDTCRLLRIAAAIEGCSQSDVIDVALTAYFDTTTVPCPYLPEDVLSADKTRKTFYIRNPTYLMLTARARMEVHSLDSVIYRALLDRLADLPEAVL